MSNRRKIFSISKNKCYDMVIPGITEKRCWGSSYGWIVTQDFNMNFKLFNPITKAELSLPSLYDLPPYSNTYTFDEVLSDGSSSDDMMEGYPWAMKVLVQKFIVLKIPGSNNIDELVVFVIHYPIDSISFARPGDKAWTEVIEPWPRNPHRPFIHHAMVWDGKVLCSHIDDTGNNAGIAYLDTASIAFAASSSNHVMAKNHSIIPYNLYGNTLETSMHAIATEGEMYMVELAGDLLIVLRQRESGISDQDGQAEYTYLWENKHCYRTINFKVYKLVRNTKSLLWENVDDLGNYMLFVGDNYATAVHTSEAPNCQKNAIYYIDDEQRVYWGASCGTDVRGHDMGMFDMASGYITSFYDGGDTISKYFAPIWFMPNF
ncbi:uncharacterized protein LOC110733731 [Chenopodium quinoa]|uniref:uncharacterized protein LOC110733731 n=1 Tax=Chenopodium quinoa TaxID=63459 RepID=UPI000B76CE08|nr:uncharacterized protein LOC110733731 [Chenopodium quinoa]